jgi:hypothetical protein
MHRKVIEGHPFWEVTSFFLSRHCGPRKGDSTPEPYKHTLSVEPYKHNFTPGPYKNDTMLHLKDDRMMLAIHTTLIERYTTIV